jgi:hypothetical protein
MSKPKVDQHRRQRDVQQPCDRYRTESRHDEDVADQDACGERTTHQPQPMASQLRGGRARQPRSQDEDELPDRVVEVGVGQRDHRPQQVAVDVATDGGGCLHDRHHMRRGRQLRQQRFV